MLKITSLKEEHLEDAAALVVSRYKNLCEQVPLLPGRYKQVDVILPLLQNILSADRPGVAALRDGRLVGFLTAWQLSSFRGKRSIYSPEWANAAILEDSRRIYEEMYSQLAGTWVSDRYIAHYISLFPNDIDFLQASHWLGFGMISVDGLCGLDPIEACNADVQVRRAGLQDLEQVMELHEALWRYMKGTPVFLLAEKRERSYYEEWLQQPDRAVWLAYSGGEPVAFIRIGPADEEVCTIIVDEKTTSIYAAFTREKARRAGIATALLDQALRSARASGYARCAVPFEPMNLIGTRFWLKYFKPVCFSILRNIDERVL